MAFVFHCRCSPKLMNYFASLSGFDPFSCFESRFSILKSWRNLADLYSTIGSKDLCSTTSSEIDP